MGFVPLTLFFVVCLQLNGNAMGIPAPAIFSNEPDKFQPWPKSCSKKYYCQELIKPTNYEYPSDADLLSMYHANKLEYDRVLLTNTTQEREGSTNICLFHQYSVEKVMMIIDENNKLRYALHIPGTFEMSIATTDCYDDASDRLEPMDKVQGIVCEQNTMQFEYVVLTPDMKDLEITKIKAFNTSCSPVKKAAKMAITPKY